MHNGNSWRRVLGWTRVISATNTQVSRVTVTKAFFKPWKVSLDAVCRHVLGSPAVMSSLVIVVDAQVLVVTRHAFSPIHPSVCSHGWPYPTCWVCDGEVGVINPSPPLFLLFVPLVLVDHFLLGVFPFPVAPNTADTPTLPADGLFHPTVIMVPCALQPYVHGMLHSGRLHLVLIHFVGAVFFECGGDHFLIHPLQFIVYSTLQHYMSWDTKCFKIYTRDQYL
jgi:hypothetical protein